MPRINWLIDEIKRITQPKSFFIIFNEWIQWFDNVSKERLFKMVDNPFIGNFLENLKQMLDSFAFEFVEPGKKEIQQKMKF